jgi:hypothetical protein
MLDPDLKLIRMEDDPFRDLDEDELRACLHVAFHAENQSGLFTYRNGF